uniref:Uncharacterized protein n=1 Tax=Rhizobium rhizogenes TaxID=359 RepID=A0A7S4ZS53_RHIRH|nr:hypothetical protein pC5.8d_722 [Rhizobium rhizogenes]
MCAGQHVLSNQLAIVLALATHRPLPSRIFYHIMIFLL